MTFRWSLRVGVLALGIAGSGAAGDLPALYLDAAGGERRYELRLEQLQGTHVDVDDEQSLEQVLQRTLVAGARVSAGRADGGRVRLELTLERSRPRARLGENEVQWDVAGLLSRLKASVDLGRTGPQPETARLNSRDFDGPDWSSLCDLAEALQALLVLAWPALPADEQVAAVGWQTSARLPMGLPTAAGFVMDVQVRYAPVVFERCGEGSCPRLSGVLEAQASGPFGEQNPRLRLVMRGAGTVEHRLDTQVCWPRSSRIKLNLTVEMLDVPVVPEEGQVAGLVRRTRYEIDFELK